MNALNLILTVINRNQEKEFIDFFHRQECHIVYSIPCHGTTHHRVLQYLGLEATDKLLLISIASSDHHSSMVAALLYEMKLDYAGKGISIVIPLHSIGTPAMKYFSYHSSSSTTQIGGAMKEEECSKTTVPYELIIAISNSGYTDLVMDAAREANASGGTVIHAKSTATEEIRHFLGISIVEEKDILLIVSKSEQKEDIMKAIQKASGIHTDAGTIVFSVPVDTVAGLHFYPDSITSIPVEHK